MRVLCAPDSFKGTLSAGDAARAMARGVLAACPQARIETCPLADGGEGTVDVIVAATSGSTTDVVVMGPRGEMVTARVGRLPDDTAIIEVADAIGLPRVPVEVRDPERTTSYGVGQLIAAALDSSPPRVIVGLGGSATVDGGLGLLQALGAVAWDEHGQPLAEPATGGDLGRVVRLDLHQLDRRIASTPIVAWPDVTHPLLGVTGAAASFGPQKGARPEQVPRLEAGLRQLVSAWGGEASVDVAGDGAAGGIAAALRCCLGARYELGSTAVLDRVGFDHKLAGVELCITGEGCFDAASLAGKVVGEVVRRAEQAGVPIAAVVGDMPANMVAIAEARFDTWASITGTNGTKLGDAAHDLAGATARAVATWLGRRDSASRRR